MDYSDLINLMIPTLSLWIIVDHITTFLHVSFTPWVFLLIQISPISGLPRMTLNQVDSQFKTTAKGQNFVESRAHYLNTSQAVTSVPRSPGLGDVEIHEESGWYKKTFSVPIREDVMTYINAMWCDITQDMTAISRTWKHRRCTQTNTLILFMYAHTCRY